MPHLTKEQAEELATYIRERITGSYNLEKFHEALDNGDYRYAIEYQGMNALEYGHARQIEQYLIDALEPDLIGEVVEVSYEESLDRTIKSVARRLMGWSPMYSSNPLANISHLQMQAALQKAHFKWLPSIQSKLQQILKENTND